LNLSSLWVPARDGTLQGPGWEFENGRVVFVTIIMTPLVVLEAGMFKTLQCQILLYTVMNFPSQNASGTLMRNIHRKYSYFTKHKTVLRRKGWRSWTLNRFVANPGFSWLPSHSSSLCLPKAPIVSVDLLCKHYHPPTGVQKL
jgi:hypothetical protein